MNQRGFGLFLAAVAVTVACPAKGADNLPPWVDRDIRNKGGIGDSVPAALDHLSFETSTVWTEGFRRFSGPSLRFLFEKLGAGAGSLRLMVTNNCSVEVSRSLLTTELPIAANRIDGMVFDRCSKDPFRVIFTFDQAQELHETNYAARVWQLSWKTGLKG